MLIMKFHKRNIKKKKQTKKGHSISCPRLRISKSGNPIYDYLRIYD